MILWAYLLWLGMMGNRSPNQGWPGIPVFVGSDIFGPGCGRPGYKMAMPPTTLYPPPPACNPPRHFDKKA